MIDPSSKWEEALGSLEPSSSPAWAGKMADAVDSLVTNKAQINGITGSVTFTFNKAIFQAQLMALAFTPLTAVAAQAIGMAWGAAMQVSTIVVAPGACMGSPAPPTLWSIIILSMIDIPMVTLAQASLIAEITLLQPVKEKGKSPLGPALFNAFSKCTATVSGLNSLPPPPAGPGPLPLMAPLMPLM